MPEFVLPASADAISPLAYTPKMTPPVPTVQIHDPCPVTDEALGQCQLPALPPHTTHRVDWDSSFQGRWETKPNPVFIYPV